MLYEPRVDCKPGKLQVAKIITSSSGNEVNLQTQTFETFSQDFEYIDLPLYLLLGRFGKLIPDQPLWRRSELALLSEWIVVPLLCYQTIRKVCRVSIEWAEAIGMHLEFDSSRMVLKIFRFPSFCRLMYQHRQRGLLSQLFDDQEHDRRTTPATKAFPTSDFFREMLLTYRLLFGQDSKSFRLFAKEMASRPNSRARCVLELPDADPLLLSLCARSCYADGVADLFDEIRADNVQACYAPASYPFFAGKLLRMQGYVKEQHPHDRNTLWHDHRNKSDWWQFWVSQLILLFVKCLTDFCTLEFFTD